MTLEFLSLAEAMEIHRDQIEHYGGKTGIRDIGLLQSALAMPSAGFGERYLHTDLFEMAAAYLFHIVQNHPFVDGNKRTGAVVALVFMALNGIEFKAGEEVFEETIRAVAQGKMNKSTIAGFFRDHAAD